MKTNITLAELLLFESFVHDGWCNTHTDRLKGMKRNLTPEENRVLAFYYGAIRILNRQGAISKDWLKKQDLLVEAPDGWTPKHGNFLTEDK